MFPVLETERLILREIEKTDAKDIFACFSRDAVTRFYGQDTLTSEEQAEGFVEFFKNSFLERRGIRWGIERKQKKGLVGTVGFNAWSPKHKRAEIGYEIHPDHWRNGYAREAVLEVISYGFNDLELNRIGAVVFLQNEASNEMLIKLGFQKEGILRDYMIQNGNPYDVNIYAKIKERRI
ncbi:GNAT family N-acetyltransferase [Bacillus sp. T33-2]|uniref:GNAT family N-acetyltransferase n=1 Tax=Bacillus sp. T33-2 TaxID=2054168 RepID=UPI000C75BBD4|nr:GNAT family protein [Bacillus sp. T33-2]PLR95223.1 GNAT family N-acetyltransferase [Bacillus sp. T33-2]